MVRKASELSFLQNMVEVYRCHEKISNIAIKLMTDCAKRRQAIANVRHTTYGFLWSISNYI